MNSTRLDTTQKILIIGFTILALGELYLFARPSYAPRSSANPRAQGISTTADTLNGVTNTSVVSAPSTTLTSIAGKITAVGSNSIDVVAFSPMGTPLPAQHVLIDSSTKIVKQGALKSQAQQDADMQAFHQYSDQLMQDPVKNKLALEHLIAPSPYQETTQSLSDLSLGEQVFVFLDSAASGSATAYKITVLPSTKSAPSGGK